MAEYSAAIDAQCEAARSYVKTFLEQAYALDPSMSAGDLQSYAYDAMVQAVQQYGGVAVEVAAQQYDLTAEQLGLDVPAATRLEVGTGGLDASDLMATARDGIGTFAKRCAARASARVRKAAAGTTVSNAMRDQAKGMSYARVPTGRETCGFCLMLASRGFVYRSKESAGQDVKFHDNCDCRIELGIEGVTRIEGYNVDAYRQAYYDARDACGIGTGDGERDNKAERDAVCREIELRAREWCWDGTAPAVDWARSRADCTEPVATAAQKLSEHGFAVKTSQGGSMYADLRMNGRMWAVSDVGGIADARAQWDGRDASPRFVVLADNDGFDAAVESVSAALLDGEQALVVSTEPLPNYPLGRIRRVDG